MTSIFAAAAATFRSFFRGKRALVLENLALRQQLAVYRRAHKRPRLRTADRAFWVCSSGLRGAGLLISGVLDNATPADA